MPFSSLLERVEKSLLIMHSGKISLPEFMQAEFSRLGKAAARDLQTAYQREAGELAGLLRRSRKFSLSADFVALADEVGKASDRTPLREVVKLSMPPFDECWIEWRARAYSYDDPKKIPTADIEIGLLIEKIASPGQFRDPQFPDDVAQYLIHNFNTDTDKHATISEFDMVSYRGTDASDPDWVPLGGGMRCRISFLGRIYQYLRNHSTAPDFIAGFDRMRDISTKNSYSTFQFLLPMLGLLSTHIHHPVTRTTTSTLPRRFIKGKYTPSYEYKIVDLIRPMDPAQLSNLLVPPRPGLGEDHRYHPVIGAWHHRRLANGPCPFAAAAACKLAVWVPVLDDDNNLVGSKQHQCVVCRRKRWWQPPHHRGNPAIGVIEKDYMIKTN